MPIKYVCRSCGHVIYEFNKIGSSVGLLSPLEVAKLLGYVCPHCKSQLSVPAGKHFKEYIIVREHRPVPLVEPGIGAAATAVALGKQEHL